MEDGGPSVSLHDGVLIRMTLAVLHDSGWYNVDFSLASPGYSWGRGLGCGFLETSCLQFSRGRADPGPYCAQPHTTPKQPRCLHCTGVMMLTVSVL